jgi:hypothetical protein
VQPVHLAELAGSEPEMTTRAAEVLVVGPDDWAIGDAAAQLAAAGRVVHRCFETSEAPFPCNALIPGRGCPLNQHHVDVVLDIRSRPGGQPSLAEMGAICGLRDGLPLVVAGSMDAGGFAPWAQRVPFAGDIVSTCDQAAAERD